MHNNSHQVFKHKVLEEHCGENPTMVEEVGEEEEGEEREEVAMEMDS